MDPESISAPNEEEFKGSLEKVEEGLKRAEAQEVELTKIIDKLTRERNAFRLERDKGKQQLQAVRKERKDYYAEAEECKNAIYKFENEKASHRSTVQNLKKQLKMEDLAMLDSSIQTLEYKIRATPDGKVSQELVLLRSQRSTLIQYQIAANALETGKDDPLKVLNLRKANATKKAAGLRDICLRHQTKVDELNAKEGKLNDELKEYLQKRNSVIEAKNHFKTTSTNLKRDYDRAVKGYQKYLRDQRNAKAQRQKKAAMATSGEDAEEESEFESSEPPTPYANELKSIDELFRHLNRLLPSQKAPLEKKDDTKTANLAEERNKKSKENREVAALKKKKKATRIF